MAEWITVADVLKVSERTVRRRIESGKLKARRDGRSWLVHSSLSEEDTDAADVRTDEVLSAESELVKELRERVQDQKEQIEEKDKQISELHQMLMVSEANQRQMLEDKRPFWQRVFRKRDKDAQGG